MFSNTAYGILCSLNVNKIRMPGFNLLPVVGLVIELHFCVRQRVVEDGILFASARAAAILPDRLLVRDADVQQRGLRQHFVRETGQRMLNGIRPRPAQTPQES